jgi:hypothetical protein
MGIKIVCFKLSILFFLPCLLKIGFLTLVFVTRGGIDISDIYILIVLFLGYLPSILMIFCLSKHFRKDIYYDLCRQFLEEVQVMLLLYYYDHLLNERYYPILIPSYIILPISIILFIMQGNYGFSEYLYGFSGVLFRILFNLCIIFQLEGIYPFCWFPIFFLYSLDTIDQLSQHIKSFLQGELKKAIFLCILFSYEMPIVLLKLSIFLRTGNILGSFSSVCILVAGIPFAISSTFGQDVYILELVDPNK